MKKYRLPIDGISYLMGVYVSQKFGQKWFAQKDMEVGGIQIKKGDDVYKKIFGWNGHNGWDIAAPRGTPIKAMSDGFIIERTDKPTGYGLRLSMAVLRDNSFHVLTYGHLLSFAQPHEIYWDIMRRDNPVKEGDVIGYVNSTGFSTGDHLHVSLYEYDWNGNKKHSNNGYGGALDIAPFLKVRLPRQVGYRKHPEKNTVLRFPDPETRDKVLSGEWKLNDVFQFEDIPYNFPLDKPEFPI